MAYTQTDLQRIEKAIATGTLEVEYADKRIKYRSIEELITARNEIQRSLQGTGGRAFRLRHGGKGT